MSRNHSVRAGVHHTVSRCEDRLSRELCCGFLVQWVHLFRVMCDFPSAEVIRSVNVCTHRMK